MYQKVSENGFLFIKNQETYRLSAYQDPANVWIIGYGYKKEVKPKQIITELTALALLQADIMDCEHWLNLIIAYPLSQCQFDALASFLFNVGPGIPGVNSGLEYLKSGSPSPLLMAVNSGHYQEAANQFLYWDYVDLPSSQRQRGRRQAERDLFLTDCSAFQSKTSVTSHGTSTGNMPRIDHVFNHQPYK
jgi:lysozyme